MHKLICLITLLTACWSSNLIAQSNWRSAEITTVDGSVLVGYAEDRTWRLRIQNIRFREANSDKAIKYPIRDIRSLRVGDRRYIVRDVDINSSPRDPRKLVPENEASRAKIRAALLVLTDGPVSLYEYVDVSSNRHYFLTKGDEELFYLDFGRYQMEKQNSKTFYKEANSYRSTLLQLLGDCDRLRPEIFKAKYTKSDLVGLIDNYYLCAQGEPAYRLEREGSSLSFGLDLGLVQSTPTYGEHDRAIFPFTDLKTQDPALGAHLRYRFGGPRGTVSIRFGAQYHAFEVGTTVVDPEEEDPLVNATFQYNYTEEAVHFQLGPEVILIRSRYPIFFETLVEYHRILNYRESRFNRRLVNGQEEIDGVSYSFSDQGALSLSAGFGVIIGKARLSLRGSASRRKYPDYVLNLYRVGLMGSYEF